MQTEVDSLACSTCKEVKPPESFYRKANHRGRSFHCKPCELVLKAEYYKKNRERIIARTCAHARKNVARIAAYHVEYHRTHTEKHRTYKREYMRRKLATDPEFKTLHLLRDRIRKALKNRYVKAASSAELVGCTMARLRKHIEAQWQPGMTWENYGVNGWHIDHIQPCASFNLGNPNEQRQCFHWTNLCPLWAEENYSKGAKWALTP